MLSINKRSSQCSANKIRLETLPDVSILYSRLLTAFGMLRVYSCMEWRSGSLSVSRSNRTFPATESIPVLHNLSTTKSALKNNFLTKWEVQYN
jgi:hypothetical protein